MDKRQSWLGGMSHSGSLRCEEGGLKGCVQKPLPLKHGRLRRNGPVEMQCVSVLGLTGNLGQESQQTRREPGSI